MAVIKLIAQWHPTFWDAVGVKHFKFVEIYSPRLINRKTLSSLDAHLIPLTSLRRHACSLVLLFIYFRLVPSFSEHLNSYFSTEMFSLFFLGSRHPKRWRWSRERECGYNVDNVDAGWRKNFVNLKIFVVCEDCQFLSLIEQWNSRVFYLIHVSL